MGISAFCGEASADPSAAGVISYDEGSTPSSGGFTDPTAALGTPERFTGNGVVSSFNPPWKTDETVSIGEGGEITLRLSHFAVPLPGGPEIGVFTNAGLFDTAYPTGIAGNPATLFGDSDHATVDVSDDGLNWVAIGDVAFDIPTNGYTDLTDPYATAPATAPADFRQPFTGDLGSFDGLSYYDAGGTDILDALAGSGGGTWLDISPSGLDRVAYVRFSVADDHDAATSLNFDLDALSIAHGAAGGAVPEPAAWTLVLMAISAEILRRGRDAAARPRS